ncbi:uracil-DNA glycosylase-like [Corticium candelabrum]|uniref:uracil-DNA glycosylase-like n=1 Tax=Corticium candelabrum TaxID=121492 RepID=UPI002E25D885|nr:uracil-DNA glycosylase-like [Corticium candelabrum]
MECAGQRKISSFFTREPAKRVQSTDDFSSPAAKHSRLESEHNNMSLTPEQKQRLDQKRSEARRLLIQKKVPQGVGPSWEKILNAEFQKPYFSQLTKFVDDERSRCTVYPPAPQVYSWTQYCRPDEVKVVIFGQDPYPNDKQAHGLCFSVPHGVFVPRSLRNIYKELASDIDGFKIPQHGHLVGWAKQGVLLLNTCLTVRAQASDSHKSKGWEQLTDCVVQWLNKNCSGLVFMLWGANAQKKGAAIDKKKHLVLKAPHPSPLSADRGFFGCCHFSKANQYLTGRGETPIDWNDLN